MSSAPLNTTEALTPSGFVRFGASILPVSIFSHCMVLIDDQTVMAIAGYQGGVVSGNTFLYDIASEVWSNGPALQFPRY